MTDKDPFIAIQQERMQDLSTRRPLFQKLAKHLKRPIVTFLTSFSHPVVMEDADAEMLENVLRSEDLSNGVALMISSPGGLPLAAERIIRILRSYSGTKEYWAIVPGKAKSAATMVCFGASKILMGPTSELGPIDPQTFSGKQVVSVHHVIDSYQSLFDKASKGNDRLEPYMQQLARYNETEINHLKHERDLAADIALRCLQTGMLCDLKPKEIEKNMDIFLKPGISKTHGRPIYREEAKNCGLNIEFCDHESDLWNLIYELYIRSYQLTNSSSPKVIETDSGTAQVSIQTASS